MNPGIHQLSSVDYHAADGISKSGLDAIARSPAHYRRGVHIESPAMRLGSAVHSAVLEPSLFLETYACANGRRSKNAEKTELTPAEWDICCGIADALRCHPTTTEILSTGAAEQSVFWYDPDTLLLCRCRPDWVAESGTIYDLKTTADASPSGFARSVEKYRYHVQAAFYTDGWNAAAEFEEVAREFIFIAVEKTPPYAIGLYRLPLWKVEEGRDLYRRDLATYEKCLIRDEWPGYSSEIETLYFTR